MKTLTALRVSLLMLAGSSLSAFAQGPGPDDQPLKHPQQQQQQHQQQPGHGQPARDAHSQPRQQANHQAQQPDFRKGRPLPSQYRGAGYQVNDWKKRGLQAPPAGHRWQNVNGNYVLIAIASGVIASVVAHQ